MSVVSNFLRTVPWRSVGKPRALTQSARHLTQPALNLIQPARHLTQPALNLIQPARHLTQPALNLIQPSWTSLGKLFFSTNPSPPVTKTATSEK